MIAEIFGHAFKSDDAAESTISCFVDEAHAAASDLFDDLVAIFHHEGGRAGGRREPCGDDVALGGAGHFLAQTFDARRDIGIGGFPIAQGFEHRQRASEIADLVEQLR